jgi:hypothetical protein
MPPEVALFLIVLIGGVSLWIAHSIRLLVKAMRFHKQLVAQHPLFSLGAYACRYSISTLGGANQGWRKCLLTITAEGMALYPISMKMDEQISLPNKDLRWFGRPVKYQPEHNELWLHFEQAGTWKLVKLKIWKSAMQELIRAYKPVVAPELVTAYRRRRPYIHQGPVTAKPAEQDIYGAWTLDEPVSLYVMPLYVVILRGEQVLRTLPLERIWQIAALRRLDEPEADGLVSLNFEGEKLAFAVKHYEQVAAAISEAAKRSLEEPVMQKQKKKDEYDDEEWEEYLY